MVHKILGFEVRNLYLLFYLMIWPGYFFSSYSAEKLGFQSDEFFSALKFRRLVAWSSGGVTPKQVDYKIKKKQYLFEILCHWL